MAWSHCLNRNHLLLASADSLRPSPSGPSSGRRVRAAPAAASFPWAAMGLPSPAQDEELTGMWLCDAPVLEHNVSIFNVNNSGLPLTWARNGPGITLLPTLQRKLVKETIQQQKKTWNF